LRKKCGKNLKKITSFSVKFQKPSSNQKLKKNLKKLKSNIQNSNQSESIKIIFLGTMIFYIQSL